MKTIFKTIIALLLVGVTSVIAYSFYSLNSIKTIDATEVLKTQKSAQPKKEDIIVQEDMHNEKALNILIMGSDKRDNGSIEGMRSDTTLIAHIPEDRKNVKIVSIPRDSWVNIPECVRSDGSITPEHTGKFNGAFSAGGANGDLTSAAACTIHTVQTLTGLTIDEYAIIDMKGFEKIVDTIGGITMTLDQPMISKEANINLEAGTHTLSGKEALGLARIRKGPGLDGSDLSRIDRQQEVFKKIIDKTKKSVTDPTKTLSLLNSMSGMVTVSPTLAPIHSYSLVAELSKAQVEFVKLPIADRGDGANVVWTQEANQLFEEFKH